MNIESWLNFPEKKNKTSKPTNEPTKTKPKESVLKKKTSDTTKEGYDCFLSQLQSNCLSVRRIWGNLEI